MQCFVALGGNIGNVSSNIRLASSLLKERVESFQLSRLYLTSAVSSIPQPDYLNAACRFECTLSPFELLSALQAIESLIGKVPKPREAPRLIDLDLLFYGEELIFERDLVVPHPRWHERLFVVSPLADLTQFLPHGIDVQRLLAEFPNHHRECVRLYEKN